MKIGILTYHCAHNCGAMLQTYALQNTIKKLGFECEVVDYRPSIITDGYKIRMRTDGNILKEFVHFLITHKTQKEKFNLFKEFEEKSLNLSRITFTKEDEILNAELKYDALICGSDQVWNMDLNGKSKVYFLDFENFKGKKISYAASIGSSIIKNEYVNEIRNYINKLDNISLRENQGREEIQKLTTKKVYQVLDPVFLMSKKDWKALECQNFKMDYDYAIIYVMEDNKIIDEISEFIATKLELKVICINSSLRKKKHVYKNISKVGPKEFVSLIKNAKLVCTNSFHGTSLSIIFKKPFITVAHSSLNSRLESILNIFNLERHCVNKSFDNVEEFKNVIEHNFDNIENILTKERNNSIKFLESSLNNTGVINDGN